MAEIVEGLGVSPGLAVGRVYVVRPQLMPVVPEPVPPERIEAELATFAEARERAREEIERLKQSVEQAVGDQYAGILAAQLLILDDPRLVRDTDKRIRVGRVSASWALKEVVGEFLRRFEAVADSYIRERGGELADVHRRLQRLLRGDPAVRQSLPEGPLIVVAHNLGPSDVVGLAGKGVVGLATDVGGRTSHTAILAQALSVPAVAGLHDVSRRVRTGDPIIIDGDTGQVRLLPDEEETRVATERHQALVDREAARADAPATTATTVDGVEITLRANIEFPLELETASRFGAQGVGLYRSEFLFLSRSPELPSEEEHFRTYVEIAERVAPHDAVIRTLDLGGEKYFHEVLESDESNPVLGLRGVRLCLERPDIFRPQLRGLLRAATRTNIKVMLPLVTTPDEIWAVKKLLADEADSLAAAGHAARLDVPLGIMIEVPAAAVAADVLAREVDFLAVGTNDLIQYSLAVDRGNESVSYLYQPLHPGLLRMLQFIVHSAARQGIPVSLCGEMAADPRLTELLVGLGLRELSMQPRALAAVREAVGQLDASSATELAGQALDLPTAEAVERRLAGER